VNLLKLIVQGPKPGKPKGRKIPDRKERRKTERLERRQSKRPKATYSDGFSQGEPKPQLPWSDDDELTNGDSGSLEPSKPQSAKQVEQQQQKSSLVPSSQPKSILKKPKLETVEADKKFIRKAIKDKLAQDDAEIAALERKLKIKDRKLPKAFIDDGLDFLLEGLGSGDESRGVKRKRFQLPEPESEGGTDSDGMGSDYSDSEEEFNGFGDDGGGR